MPQQETIRDHVEKVLNNVKKTLKITEHKIVDGDVKSTLNLQEIKIQIQDTKARSNRIALQNELARELTINSGGHEVKVVEPSREAIPPIEIHDRQGKLQGLRIFFKPLGRATPVTEFSESLVAYACAIHQKLGRDIEVNDLHDGNLPASKNVFAENKGTRLTLSNCVGALNDEWWQSSVAIANALMGSSHVDSSISYNFHRGDMFMDNLYKKARVVLKAGDDSGKFGSMDMNKWNPSDIWLSSNKLTKQSINEEVDKMKGGIQQFNAMLTRLRKEKKLIGISLKKTEGATTKIDLVKNESKSLAEKGLDLSYMGPTDSTKKFQKSNILQFKLDGNLGDLQFRNFSSTPNKNGFQGNITKLQGQSEAAVHGKVGVWRLFMDESGAPKKFKQSYGMAVEAKNLPTINREWDHAMKNNSWTPEMSLFKNLYNKVNGKSHDNMFFITKWSGAKEYDFCSNLLALQVVEQTERFMSKKVQTEFISNIVLYAMSQIPGISSTYLKNK